MLYQNEKNLIIKVLNIHVKTLELILPTIKLNKYKKPIKLIENELEETKRTITKIENLLKRKPKNE